MEPDLAQDRQAFARRGEHRREVIPVLAELGEAVARHVHRRLRLAVRLERTDDEPAAVVPRIEVAVEVAQESGSDSSAPSTGSVITQTCSAGYSDTDVPAIRASSEVHRPAASTTVSASMLPASVWTPVTVSPRVRNPVTVDAEDEPRAAVRGALGKRERRVARVHGGVARRDDRPHEILGVGDRPPVAHLRGLEHLTLDVELPVHVGAQHRISCMRPGVRATVSAPTRRSPSRRPSPRQRLE